jgi:hypothetical protein
LSFLGEVHAVNLELRPDGCLSPVTCITVANFRSEDDDPRKFAFVIGYQSITDRALGVCCYEQVVVADGSGGSLA